MTTHIVATICELNQDWTWWKGLLVGAIIGYVAATIVAGISMARMNDP